MPSRWFLLFSLVAVSALACDLSADEFQPDQKNLPVPPPEGAIVLLSPEVNLFLSKNGEASNWAESDGVVTSTPNGGHSNHIVSKLHFRDADIHVECKLPEKGPGNSGIYIHGNYELQILNSADKEKVTQNDMGSVYGFAPPLVNAAKKPGEWQVYDIRYRAPRRDKSGKIVEPGRITAWLNGQKVQENTPVEEPRSVYHPYRYRSTDYLKTIWEKQKKTLVGPVFLQDHGNPVEFRNVWVKPLDDKSMMYEPSK